ncbi:MAG: hypothetical protein F4Y84_06675, partial [Caldilineaceae bacterium SB0665_bin_25]|nr:hypothetical protein [Caldilineaceae bacterium SB0665_bin_25]
MPHIPRHSGDGEGEGWEDSRDWQVIAAAFESGVIAPDGVQAGWESPALPASLRALAQALNRPEGAAPPFRYDLPPTLRMMANAVQSGDSAMPRAAGDGEGASDSAALAEETARFTAERILTEAEGRLFGSR